MLPIQRISQANISAKAIATGIALRINPALSVALLISLICVSISVAIGDPHSGLRLCGFP